MTSQVGNIVPHTPLSSADTAMAMQVFGYSVVTIQPGTQACREPGWTTPKEHKAWPDDYGVGVLLGAEVTPGYRFIAIDIDTNEPDILAAVRRECPPDRFPMKHGRRGVTVFCLADVPRKEILKLTNGGKIELLSQGQQTVLPPTIHPGTGKPYTWLGSATLLSYLPAELPRVDDIENLLIKVCGKFAATEWTSRKGKPTPAGDGHGIDTERLQWGGSVVPFKRKNAAPDAPLKPKSGDYPLCPPETLAALLASIPAEDREVWLKVGGVVYRTYAGTEHEDAAREIFDDWAATASNHAPGETDRKWRDGDLGKCNSEATFGTIVHLHRAHDGTVQWPPKLHVQEGARAEIEVADGGLVAQVTACNEVLQGLPDIYWCGELVSAGSGVIQPLDKHRLSLCLARDAMFFKWRQTKAGEDFQAALDPPLRLMDTVLASAAHARFRKLEAIITAPTLRPDGGLLSLPGYDAQSGLLYEPDGDYPAIADAPGWNEALAACEALMRPVSLFPYETDVDKAAMLACLLTATVRRTLRTSPAFLFEAAAASSGKTMAASVAAVLAGVNSPMPRTWPSDNEEMRKSITASLRSASPILFFDNITGTVKSPAFDALLTSPGWTDRLLGASEDVTLPSNVLVLMTGNNAVLAGDTWRRVIGVRIDPKDESPEKRSFPFQPIELTCQTKPQMIAAALTILRAFIAAGKPRATTDVLGSFEAWDALVRQCVLWLGYVDPVAHMQSRRASDPDTEKLGTFLHEAHEAMGDKWIAGASHMRPDLRAAVEAIAKPGKEISALLFGHWLSRKRETRLNGYRLVRAEERSETNVTHWRVAKE